MAQLTVIDSHIHLWPESMSNEEGHAWMTPGMPLARQHILPDYYKASRQDKSSKSGAIVEGVIYVETDVRYDTPNGGDLRSWAQGPLDELTFLRAIVEGEYGERDSEMLLGIVAWAPMDQPPHVLVAWLRLAEETAGPKAWKRVKGFRFLLQSIHDRAKFETLVHSEDFIHNLQLLGSRGFSFDVGVDQHSGGVWQLQAIATAMEKAHRGVAEEERVVFVANHLCKPDFVVGGSEFEAWKKAIVMMSALSKTYMKLSGGFSELPEAVVAAKNYEANAIAEHMKPWVEHVLTAFGPGRVMFGSDWPVCNVRGPCGEQGSWLVWTDVVASLLDNHIAGLEDKDKASVWRAAARRAYRISEAGL